jgi:hypothetical protein
MLFLLIMLFLLPCCSCLPWFFLFVIPGGDLLLLLPLLVLSHAYPNLCHFDRSSSRILRTAKRRNPLLYPNRSQAKTSAVVVAFYRKACLRLTPKTCQAPKTSNHHRINDIDVHSNSIHFAIMDRREQKAPERSGAFLLHQIEQKPFEWNTLRDGYIQNQYFTTRQNRSPDLSRIIPIL